MYRLINVNSVDSNMVFDLEGLKIKLAIKSKDLYLKWYISNIAVAEEKEIYYYHMDDESQRDLLMTSFYTWFDFFKLPSIVQEIGEHELNNDTSTVALENGTLGMIEILD